MDKNSLWLEVPDPGGTCLVKYTVYFVSAVVGSELLPSQLAHSNRSSVKNVR